jgi:hypothetical protein
MHCAINKVSHVVRRLSGKWVLRESRSGGYIVRPLPRHLQLAVRRVRKQSDQNISSAISRIRSCTISVFVRSGASEGAKGRGGAIGPPSFSHRDSALRRISNGSGL